MAGAKHTTTFDVPLDALWDVITDYEGYPEFVADLESLEVTKREKNVIYATYVIAMMGKKVKCTLKHTETPKKKLVWEMTEGEMFKFNNGGWELKEMGEGKVEATYTMDVGFPIFLPVPKSMIDMLTAQKLPTMMQAFEERAKAKLQKAAKGKKQ
jgi:ribosome-associated toxin RatA of RatAB toxin-antitoxin module